MAAHPLARWSLANVSFGFVDYSSAPPSKIVIIEKYLHRLLDKLDAWLKAPIHLKNLNDTNVLIVRRFFEFQHMNAFRNTLRSFSLQRLKCLA